VLLSAWPDGPFCRPYFLILAFFEIAWPEVFKSRLISRSGLFLAFYSTICQD
jgi:hypothetical protein